MSGNRHDKWTFHHMTVMAFLATSETTASAATTSTIGTTGTTRVATARLHWRHTIAGTNTGTIRST